MSNKQTKDSQNQKKSVTYKGMRGAQFGFSSTSPPLSWARACICDVGKHGLFFLSIRKAPYPSLSAIKGPGPDRYVYVYVYLLVCPRLKEVCKTRIVRKFRARITYKVDKTELLFDHLLLSVVFDRDLLPLVLSAAASSSLLSSAVLNAPWPACEMCVRACVSLSLSVSGFVSHRLCCS